MSVDSRQNVGRWPVRRFNCCNNTSGHTPNRSPCLLEMRVIGFGLCNALATFTRLMTHVLDPCIHQFVIVYLEDICIYSKTPEEHLDPIRQVLVALRNNKEFIKMVECF